MLSEVPRCRRCRLHAYLPERPVICMDEPDSLAIVYDHYWNIDIPGLNEAIRRKHDSEFACDAQAWESTLERIDRDVEYEISLKPPDETLYDGHVILPEAFYFVPVARLQLMLAFVYAAIELDIPIEDYTNLCSSAQVNAWTELQAVLHYDSEEALHRFCMRRCRDVEATSFARYLARHSRTYRNKACEGNKISNAKTARHT
jgi:hypothetical protein